MNYILTTRSESELYHWKYASKKRVNGKWQYRYSSKSKGQEDHKYIARILNPVGSKNKYTYFYTMEEWQAHLKKQPVKVESKANDSFSPELKNFMTRVINKSGALKQQTQKVFGKFSKINPSSLSNEEHQAMINPLYEYSELAEDGRYTENCASCAVAYDLRKRGYDVVVAPISDVDSMGGDDPETPNVYNMLKYWYKPEPENMRTDVESVEKTSQQIDEWTSALPENARGMFVVSWAFGDSGHAMTWEKENGKTIVRDCQTNEMVTLTDVLERSDYVSMIRTDNVEPTEFLLSKVVDGPEARKQNEAKINDIETALEPYTTQLEALEKRMSLTTDMVELVKLSDEAAELEEQMKNTIKKKL